MSKQPKKQTIQHPTIGRAVPREFIKSEFTKLFRKGDSGGNDYLAEFLVLMDNLCESARSFTVLDCLYLAQRFSIPPLETKRLFERWTDFMLGWNKITVVEGAYDCKLVVLL
jgi:hypothetical protein